VDDVGFEGQVPEDELEAVRRELAGLGQQPLPPAVALRLDARLAAELSATPLARRRSRRRLRLGASLSAAAAVAAAIVFALSSGSGRPAPEAAALRSSAPAAAADSAATTAVAAKTAVGAAGAVAPEKCSPPSRTAGGRPRAACPGARGGHARAV
jgi:hypothetical protein